jgi:hypothetical protein
MSKPEQCPSPGTGDEIADHALSSVFSDVSGPNSSGVRCTPTTKPRQRKGSPRSRGPTGDRRVDNVLEYVGKDINPDPLTTGKGKQPPVYIDPYTGNQLPRGQITGDRQADQFIRGVGSNVNPAPKKTPRRARIQSQNPSQHKPQPMPAPSEVIPSQYLSGLTLEERLTKAIKLSVSSGLLKKELVKPLQELLKPENIGVLTGIFALWGAAHLWGAGEVADADLAALMVVTMGADGVKALGNLFEFFKLAEGAKTETDLTKAGDEFAKFVSLVGTSALGVLVGKAGQAVGKLNGTLAEAAGKLGKLTPDLIRRGETAIRTGSKLLKDGMQAARKVGRRLKKEGLEAIDGILGIFQKKREVVGGGKLPGKQSGGNGSGEGRTLKQDYEALSLELELPLKLQAQLLEKSISAQTIKALNDRGLSPEKLNEFLDKILKSKEGYQLNQMPRIADTLEALTSKGVKSETAKKILLEASRQKEILDALQKLMLGKGRLVNPQALEKLVENAVREFGDNLKLRGSLREIQIAVDRVEQGHTIQMGVIKDASGKLVGGDIVDLTTREVIQAKATTTSYSEGVWDNAEKAVSQLLGMHGEHLNVGFTKIAEIRIGSQNQLFNLSGKKINGQILGEIGGKINKEFDGFINIVKEDSKGNVIETLRFRIEKGTSQLVPQQPLRNLHSNNTENNITIASEAQKSNQSKDLSSYAKNINSDLSEALSGIEKLNIQWYAYRRSTSDITPDLEVYQRQQLVAITTTSDNQMNKVIKDSKKNREPELG